MIGACVCGGLVIAALTSRPVIELIKARHTVFELVLHVAFDAAQWRREHQSLHQALIVDVGIYSKEHAGHPSKLTATCSDGGTRRPAGGGGGGGGDRIKVVNQVTECCQQSFTLVEARKQACAQSTGKHRNS